MFGLSFSLPTFCMGMFAVRRDAAASVPEAAEMPRVEKTERTRRAHHDEDMEPMIMLVAAACGAANQDIFGRWG